jgi:phosphoribosylaminoimidazole-succinocarboxamide synthase
MTHGALLAEGKTKQIFAHATNPDWAVVVSKDDITAGDGARRHTIPGKGALSGATTANIFTLLQRHQIPTHFVERLSDTEMVVQRCQMIPIEVVTRRHATGSYLRRHPEFAEGHRFEPLVVEFFFKDDANHDPLMSTDELITANITDKATLEEITLIAKTVFEILEHTWQNQQVTLVDMKIEFGRTTTGQLVVADVIDNDAWRLWPQGNKDQMLDKQVYRNMREVTDEGLAQIKALYATVKHYTDTWI